MSVRIILAGLIREVRKRRFNRDLPAKFAVGVISSADLAAAQLSPSTYSFEFAPCRFLIPRLICPPIQLPP